MLVGQQIRNLQMLVFLKKRKKRKIIKISKKEREEEQRGDSIWAVVACSLLVFTN